MRIAPAALFQAPALAALHAAAFPRGWSAAEIARVMAAPGALALAAWEGEALGGFALARVAADEAEILTLAVDPLQRRRGLGAGLVDGVARLATDLGARALFLEVAADNAPALALYRERGFAPVGARPAYYARPGGAQGAVVMRRRLLEGGGPAPIIRR